MHALLMHDMLGVESPLDILFVKTIICRYSTLFSTRPPVVYAYLPETTLILQFYF